MAKKKDKLLKESIEKTFAPLSLRPEKPSPAKRKGIREGTIGLSGARLIPISRIRPDPNQPRKMFPEKSLQELAQSIRQHGLLQPITVEYLPQEDYFKIINGMRRYQACLLASLKNIACIIKDKKLHSEQRLEEQLVENLQREDLAPIEEAEAYKILTHKYSYTHEQLAKKIGKTRSVISETLSLNKLPESIKQECRARDIAPKKVLLQVVRQPDSQGMLAFWKKVREQHLSLREAIKQRKSPTHRAPLFEYKYEAPDKKFTLKIKFRKSKVQSSELIQAVRHVLHALTAQKRA